MLMEAHTRVIGFKAKKKAKARLQLNFPCLSCYILSAMFFVSHTSLSNRVYSNLNGAST